jgi:hypothetical protein
MTEVITAKRANELSLVTGSRENCRQIFMSGCFPSYFTDFLRRARPGTEKFSHREASKNFPSTTVFHWVLAFVAIL